MIILGIGSNLSSKFGDRIKNIDLSIQHLKENNINIIKKSSYYETPSYPDPNKPKFINVIVSIENNVSPEKLVSIIINIEKLLERKRLNKNDPRTCDIDIIDFNNEILNFNYSGLNFNVPHKDLYKRNFVLYPLLEIAPYWVHPVSKIDITALIDKLSDEEKKSILKITKN